MGYPHRNRIALVALATSLAIVTGCESIQKSASTKLPIATAKDLRIKAADFSTLDLLLDVGIDNPNPFGLTLSGLSYDFVVNNQPLLQGEQNNTLRIEAAQESTLSVPLSLTLQTLANEIPEILQSDSFDYELNTQLQFNLPLLGSFKVPLTKTGSLPVIRPPRISDVSLAKRKLNLTGADLDLTVNIENPNAFNLVLNGLDYTFTGNQNAWAKGKIENAVEVSSKGDSSIKIPLHLDFIALGTTAFQLLGGSKEFEAALDGSMTLNSSLDFLRNAQLPIHFEKNLSLK